MTIAALLPRCVLSVSGQGHLYLPGLASEMRGIQEEGCDRAAAAATFTFLPVLWLCLGTWDPVLNGASVIAQPSSAHSAAVDRRGERLWAQLLHLVQEAVHHHGCPRWAVGVRGSEENIDFG